MSERCQSAPCSTDGIGAAISGRLSGASKKYIGNSVKEVVRVACILFISVLTCAFVTAFFIIHSFVKLYDFLLQTTEQADNVADNRIES